MECVSVVMVSGSTYMSFNQGTGGTVMRFMTAGTVSSALYLTVGGHHYIVDTNILMIESTF